MGGNIPYSFIETLAQGLYGIVQDGDGERINFERKMELEEELQSENQIFYST